MDLLGLVCTGSGGGVKQFTLNHHTFIINTWSHVTVHIRDILREGPPPLLPDITTAHRIDMYIYLYTENEYILDTLDIKYIQRTEPTFLFKTRYSDSPDKKELRFFFHQNLENSSVPHRTKHTKNGTYSQNTLTNKIDIFSPRSLLPLMGTVVFL